ncbi:hypothetical protein PV326_002325 [Microctonus aethiopoides]|nr:hypothetical protein PV326_002325 [Microctonus aethiopoides]
MLKLIEFQCFIIIILTVGINLILAIPTPTINVTNPREIRSPSNYVEIKLPVKVRTVHELVDWIKNAMQTMASKIDITLASPNGPNSHQESSSAVKDTKFKNVGKSLKTKNKLSQSRNTFTDIESPWTKDGNEILSPLINIDTFLPLIFGDGASKLSIKEFKKNGYTGNNDKIITTTEPSVLKVKNLKQLNESKLSNQLTTPETRDPPDDFPPYFEKNPVSLKKESNKNELHTNTHNNDNSKERQTTNLNDILKALGITRKLTTKSKIQEAATISTVAMTKPTNKSREQFLPQPSFDFEDPLEKPRRNESSQRQEFDDDGDDDEDYEEDEQGSLGSIADLLPLALPILEDLSNPEGDTDLIEVLQAAIPLIQGLSEPDEDGNGGAKELIDMIVPIITKIVRGKDGEGIDIGALIGPLFGLIAPFIGPVLAPIIGPLIRTISNPPTGEGSSLASLITAITGPLSTPQEPSGMSPLSIVIAGTTAALLKEIKPGSPGGSDLGALVGAILSGVIAGTSGGLSGGSSGPEEPGYAPYKYDLQSPIFAGTVNTGFTGRPSPGPPLNSPFNILRPNHPENAVNIGSTHRPLSLNHPSRPPSHAPQFLKPGPTPYTQSQSYSSHLHGPVPAAATNANGGGSSYLPYGATPVPANSVNPFSLITMSVKDILGAGIQVVSTLVNAIFGIIGASSMEQPKPSYGPPSSAPYH